MALLIVTAVNQLGDGLWAGGLYRYGIYIENTGHTVPIMSFSALFLLWSASKGVRGITQGMEEIFGVGQNYIAVLLRSVVYTVVIIAVVVFSFVVLVLASPLEQLAKVFLGGWADVVLGVLNLRNVIFFLSLWLLFACAYKNLAPNSICFRCQLTGGAFASAGWIVTSFGFSVYIKHFYRYPVVYGSFGAVVLFMMWLYICMNILLCGALINRIKWQKGNNCD